MARKKKLDKLSLDMIQCAKDGFGCKYGRWKATQKAVIICWLQENCVTEGVRKGTLI